MSNTNNPNEEDSSKRSEKLSGAEEHVTEEAGAGKATDKDNKDASSRRESFVNVLSGANVVHSVLKKGLGKEEGVRDNPPKLPKRPDGKSELKMACDKASKEIFSKFQLPEINMDQLIKTAFGQGVGKKDDGNAPKPENIPMEVELESSTSKATSLNKAGPSGVMIQPGASSRKSLSKKTSPRGARSLPIESGPSGAMSLPLFHEDDLGRYKKSTPADLERELQGMKNILEQRALDLLAIKESVLLNKKEVRRLDIFVPICDFTSMNYRTMTGYDGKSYRIVIDMSFFEPENIIVQVVRDTVNVFATAEYESSEGYQAAEFHEVYRLPDDVNKDKVKAHMPHPLKMLCICAPIKRAFKD